MLLLVLNTFSFVGSIVQWLKCISYMSHLFVESKKAKHTETESRVVAARNWGMGEIGRHCSEGTNF